MRCAAFFRNVNLGRTNAPSREQLEAAFREAGAASASSFLVNGTLVFDTPAGVRPRALAARACALMRTRCGLREPVFVRRVDELAALVASEPFADVPVADPDFACITFLAGHRAALPALPSATPRGDIEFVAATGAEVLSIARLVGRAPGSPNAWLERRLEGAATTRNWRTVVRLVDRFT